MSATRTFLLALLVVGGCSHGRAETEARGDDPTSGSTATRADEAGEVTAMEQGESAADLEITRSVRAAILRDASLSVGAHDILIVTREAVVTLRGNVTRAERTAIETHAREAAGVRRVMDELTVEP